jgi:predicted Zn-dependent peptidase
VFEAEGLDAVTEKVIQQRMFGLPTDFWERYRGDIEAITAADLQATSRTLLVDQPLQVVVIGRADKLVKALAGHGEVRVYNTDLQRITAK